jgi:hypothetical protein
MTQEEEIFIRSLFERMKRRLKSTETETFVKLRKIVKVPGKTRNESIKILDKYCEKHQ